jgi:hypothetical protein
VVVVGAGALVVVVRAGAGTVVVVVRAGAGAVVVLVRAGAGTVVVVNGAWTVVDLAPTVVVVTGVSGTVVVEVAPGVDDIDNGAPDVPPGVGWLEWRRNGDDVLPVAGDEVRKLVEIGEIVPTLPLGDADASIVTMATSTDDATARVTIFGNRWGVLPLRNWRKLPLFMLSKVAGPEQASTYGFSTTNQLVSPAHFFIFSHFFEAALKARQTTKEP